MLAGMIEIDDWNRAREVPTGDIPDPLGSVADDHLLLRPAPAAFPGFSVDARAERFGRFNCADISGGGFVSHRPAFRIGRGLSEDAAQFDLAGACRLSLYPAGAAFQFAPDDGDLGAVDLDIEYRHCRAQDLRQFQLEDAVDLDLLSLRDIGPDGFRLALHRFGGYLQASQQFQLRPAFLEAHLAAHHRQHAAHSG